MPALGGTFLEGPAQDGQGTRRVAREDRLEATGIGCWPNRRGIEAWDRVAVMSHALVIALFEDPKAAGLAARELRALGIPPHRVSIVARSHDEEGALARAADASPGSEIEDSRVASRLGELSAHFIAAVALVVPGIGPIVADGPLAAGFGEAAGHLGGGVARALERAGLARHEAEMWESHVRDGAVLIGAHVPESGVPAARERLTLSAASRVSVCAWPE
jgi:hypothetical protein